MGLDFSVRSLRCQVATRIAGTPVREALSAFLADLAGRLDARGCTFIGHIKGRAAAAGEEPLFFSLTRLGGLPQFKGGRWEHADRLDMSVSVILAGLREEEIGRTTQETLKAHFQIFSEEAKGEHER